MWGLRDGLPMVSGFVMGCTVSHPEVFDSLGHWSIARINGARDQYGWSGALEALAGERFVEAPSPRPDAPLASVYLSLVAEYLAELEDEAAPGRLKAAYDEALARFALHHEREAHSGRFNPFEGGWHAECWRWQQGFAPALRYLPDGELGSRVPR